MRLLKIIIITIILTTLAMDIYFFHTRIPNDNDCMITYINSGSDYGTIYKFDTDYHIQSDRDIRLSKNEVWYTNGCMMYSDTVLSSIWNTQACYVFKLLIAMK